jgi:hypothetical protein
MSVASGIVLNLIGIIMIKINTKIGDILVVEIPEECFKVTNIDYPDWYLDNGIMNIELVILYGKSGTLEKRFDIDRQIKNCNLLGKLSQLDKELEEFVDVKNNWYKNYIIGLGGINWHEFKAPKQSFISLIKSQHPEFDENKEYLLIKLG